MARADFEVQKAKVDLNTMGQTLNRLLGRPIRTEFILVNEPAAIVNESKEENQISQALNQRPELNELKFNIHREKLEGKIELSRYIPDISFGVAGVFSRNFNFTFPQHLYCRRFSWRMGAMGLGQKNSIEQRSQQQNAARKNKAW